MSYTPTAGIITAIEYQGDGAFGGSDCTLLLTVQSEDQGLVHILLPPGAYVLNLHPFQVGDRATFFYSLGAPMPLVFPPRYRAVAAAYTPQGVTAVLDVFDGRLLNSAEAVLGHSGDASQRTDLYGESREPADPGHLFGHHQELSGPDCAGADGGILQLLCVKEGAALSLFRTGIPAGCRRISFCSRG